MKGEEWQGGGEGVRTGIDMQNEKRFIKKFLMKNQKQKKKKRVYHPNFIFRSIK